MPKSPGSSIQYWYLCSMILKDCILWWLLLGWRQHWDVNMRGTPHTPYKYITPGHPCLGICVYFVIFISWIYLKTVVMHQQLWSFLPHRQFLCYYVSCLHSRTLAYGKNRFYDQDVFITHGFECTWPNIMIFSLKIMITLSGHWFGRH